MDLAPFFAGFALWYFTVLVRTLPWPAAWLLQKPLSCATCLLGWSAIIAWLWDGRWSLKVAVSWGAAAGVGLLLEAVRERLQGWGAPPR